MRTSVPLLLCLAVLVGCGPTDGSADSPSASEPGQSAVAAPPIAFRGAFEVDDEVWYVGQSFPDLYEDVVAGQRNGLLEVNLTGSLYLNVPVVGRYPVEVVSYDDRPSVPQWCEDVVEASYEQRRSGALLMSTFEAMETLGELARGEYRVRLCADGLDRAATEGADDAFVGEGDDLDYKTYTSRHLLQIWPSPTAPDEIVRVGSAFAGAQHHSMG